MNLLFSILEMLPKTLVVPLAFPLAIISMPRMCSIFMTFIPIMPRSPGIISPDIPRMYMTLSDPIIPLFIIYERFIPMRAPKQNTAPNTKTPTTIFRTHHATEPVPQQKREQILGLVDVPDCEAIEIKGRGVKNNIKIAGFLKPNNSLVCTKFVS